MHKIDAPFNDNGSFTDRNTLTGQHGTFVDAAWLNSIQSEILNVLASAGIIPIKGQNNQLNNAINFKIQSQAGVPNGLATLGNDGKIPSIQLPSYVDDVVEYVNLMSFPLIGESGKIYIDLATNFTYRWSGTTYVKIGSVNGYIVADEALKLSIPVNINGVPFDGTNNITINASDLVARIAVSEKGAVNGVATLNALGYIPSSQIDPSSISNVASAQQLSIPKTISASGDISFSYNFDGSTNVGFTTTLSNTGVVSGSYFRVTVDSKGRITGGSNPNTIAGFGITDALNVSEKGMPNGIATLDGTGKIPSAQLPSYVDDVEEYASFISLPITGEAGKLYVTLDDNRQYRWASTVYVQITSGAVDSVAGKTGVVSLIKADVGLNNVDNTADSVKNVLSATKLSVPRQINGVAFDGTADISFSYSDMKVYADISTFPVSGSGNTLYIAQDTTKTYRWNGLVYVRVGIPDIDELGLINADLSLLSI